MTAAILVLGALAVLPMRWTSWAGGLRAVPMLLIAPVSGLVSSLTGWMSPPDGADKTAEFRKLEDERNLFQAMYLQQREQVEALQKQLDEFRAHEQPLGLRHLLARVIGSPSNPGSGVLIVKAGKRHGVEPRTVAVAGGSQVVGRVEEVSATTCSLVLLTTLSAGPVGGIVPAENTEDPALKMPHLYPTKDGTLSGLVEYDRARPGKPQRELKIGDTVRLSDDTWPSSAQMLVLGTIVRIDPTVESALRKRVTVLPTFRLDRVTEVTLRLAERAEGGGP
jgi:cell shape-determining protein MreC